MMNDIEEKLHKSLNEMLKSKDMRALNIAINKRSFGYNIQIIIDSSNGISLDDCSLASKITNDVIKVDKIIEGEFNLEVSSPGINRELFSIEDFLSFKGSKVKIKLKKIHNDSKNIVGIIDNIIGNNININVDNQTTTIDFNDIKKANLRNDIKV